jgi:hypothetical protein
MLAVLSGTGGWLHVAAAPPRWQPLAGPRPSSHRSPERPPAGSSTASAPAASRWRSRSTPPGKTQVGPDRGPVTALVDRTPFGGDPRDMRLDRHTVLQLDVGTAVPFQPSRFPAGL